MSVLVECLGWTLLHSLWQGAVVWLALRAALVILARRSANARCIAACTALAMAVLAFAITFTHVQYAERHSVAGSAGSLTIFLGPGPQDSLPGGLFGSPISAPPSRISGMLATLLPFIVLFWAMGCAWSSVKMAMAWRNAQSLFQTFQRPASAWLETRCQELARQLGVKPAVRIGESAQVDGPSVVGWLKPLILVPIGAFSGLDPCQIDGLLAHELAHVVRHDFVINLLQSVCEILFFYHPAIWAISQWIRIERENACDDIAVAFSGDPRAYAEALTKLEEGRCPSLALAANGGGTLLARLHRLLAAPTSPRRGIVAASWTLIAGVVIALAALFVAPGIADRLLAAQPVTPPNKAQISSATANPTDAAFGCDVNFVPFTPQWDQFSPGDIIAITSVKGDRNHLEPGGTYLVEGTYTLASMETAGLSVSVTALSRNSPGARSPGYPEQGTTVRKGSGRFSLRITMRYSGAFHVSFNPPEGGESRGTVYFSDFTSLQPETKTTSGARPTIVVAISGDNTISVNGKNVRQEQLVPLLLQMHYVDIAASVAINADEMADFKALKFVMDSCLTAGLTKISLHPGMIVIGIDKDGVISVNRGNVTEVQLGPLLTQMHIASPAITVLIKCDEINQMKTLAFVMESCRNAGINEFSLQSR